ncbi:hypothetical protein Kpol_1036p4 [Vanderwaltozyma polyspora DSM 70294]|uniref:Phosphoribulokinase/uridine kinase domain-containing protein n=1 Tax=Vanderwaltozyma polyspora (strain ATCC 22028 / DSM 70294 / BCRC 21397 / CBS 2163 / NBRC 10782 / NRRL Y-8283 / UCD 57-17) TaxID=436907 RepID=A7TEF5_VANPO|nr:uncharacterized protein Kpol_1036p4 [Vanderwaltozyma polyspora DSM 70294]EDO19262.1 hypothetical protein Kpol_1036p4 [Vanderwaltozyma polyspora DSM 70294]
MKEDSRGKIIVSIGGGHATGSVELANVIRQSLVKKYKQSDIRIIDLDSKVDKLNRKYSNADFDFESLYVELTTNDKDNVGKNEQGDDPCEIIFVCGCYSLYDEKIRSISKLKVYLDSDADKRLINLIQFNKIETPTELSGLLSEYMDNLRDEMIKHIEPTRVYADLIIPYTNETIGSAIMLDGISKVIEELKGNDKVINLEHNKIPLLNFEAERIDVQKSRYYDLS